MPPYLHLCLETWRRHLKDVDFIALDYSNVGKFLPRELPKSLSDYTLPQQADFIRFALLAHNGGIWMDVDTIATRKPDTIWKSLADNDVVLLGSPGKNGAFNNFIAVNGPKDDFLRAVHDEVTAILKMPKPKNAAWDHVTKPFITRVAESDFAGSRVKIIPGNSFEYIAELANGVGYGPQKYRDFWFDTEREFSPSMVEGNGGLIGLHNSWSPPEYKEKPRDYILYEGREMMSKYIRYALLN